MYRVGVDVGGTFTDFTLLDERQGTVLFHKSPSTADDPSAAIERGLDEIATRHGVDLGRIVHLGHGTTVATNLVIEGRGEPVGLITTRGFRDVLEIGRQTRPDLYDYRVRRPPPLARRAHRLEVTERMAADGTVLVPLDAVEVAAAARALAGFGLKSVAILFLHAYRNPAHERRARDIVAGIMEGAFITLSSDVLPEFREYERASTTALNAYVGPRMRAYLDRFVARVRGLGVKGEPYTIHSNGGLMSIATAGAVPVRTCLSGPAAGVVGAAAIAAAAGFPDVVTFDVGGTSTDVSLVKDGKPLFTGDRLVAGYPVRTPMIDVHVIGAGGGSIARIDDAGGLKVGPESAGAEPGPVAYGRGGRSVTLTDANLVLGRLNGVALLDGRMPVDRDAAARALDEQVARPLGITLERAAQGILAIAVSNIARAIRSVSTERGHDLAGFALFACGGAGPLHAAEVALEVGCPRILVPQAPGTLCARGILLSDLNFDFVRTLIATADPASWANVVQHFHDMRTEAEAWLGRERVPADRRRFRCFIEARYRGQNFEVPVELPAIAAEGLAGFLAAFAARHHQEYGYAIAGRAVEIVNGRIQAIGAVPKAPLEANHQGGPSLGAARVAERPVWFGESWHETEVYSRARLPVGEPIPGPAIIEEMSSTTWLPPGQAARVDGFGNIVIDLKESGAP